LTKKEIIESQKIFHNLYLEMAKIIDEK